MSAIQEAAARLRRVAAMKSQTTANAGGVRLLAGVRLAKLLNETVERNNVLRHGMRMAQVPQGTTTMDFADFDGQYFVHVPNDGDVVAAVRDPAYREVDINPAHYKMDLEISRRAELRVRALTDSSLKAELRAGFKTQLGNSLARASWIGDTTSADATLNGNNGIYTLARAGGLRLVDLAETIGGVRVATAFDPTRIYPRAMQALERPFRSRKARWFFHEDELIHWGNWLQDQKNSDALIQQVLAEGLVPGPWGHAAIETDFWPEAIGTSGAPTSVVDDGDGTMTIRLATIMPDAYDGGANARRVRVTLDATGATEDGTVVRVAGQNQLLTTGDLGQAVISVVAADYTVTVIDERSNILSDPNNFGLFVVDKVRAYDEFDTDKESEVTKVHLDVDTRIIRQEAGVLAYGYYHPNLAA